MGGEIVAPHHTGALKGEPKGQVQGQPPQDQRDLGQDTSTKGKAMVGLSFLLSMFIFKRISHKQIASQSFTLRRG